MFLGNLKKCVLFAILWTGGAQAQKGFDARPVERYLKPYVESGNFSGQVVIQRDGKTIFEKAYGFADREKRIENTAATRFHIASLSMQFTAAAIMRLVDKGAISLDTAVDEVNPEVAFGRKITVRDLLTERSGLPDINDLPDYADILRHHQTPAGLIDRIKGQALLFEPGSKFLHEEHSAYNLLALIVERKTGLAFGAAVKNLVFRPLGRKASGVDDDSPITGTIAGRMAKGYEPAGTFGLKPATAIHWSAKTGNASVFTTALDEARWIDALLADRLLSARSREAVLDPSLPVGYGWFKRVNKRFGEAAYSMNGRSPGFASFALHLPREKATIIVLSNVYSSATSTIGNDIAAIALGMPYEAFQPQVARLNAVELKVDEGVYRFGPDFYQANADLELSTEGADLALRWPSGDISPLIPLGRDHFIDRGYWETVGLERDVAGRPVTLVYGGFRGRRIQP
jgi:D-alanyl-D-alanine carboxypeptidase